MEDRSDEVVLKLSWKTVLTTINMAQKRIRKREKKAY